MTSNDRRVARRRHALDCGKYATPRLYDTPAGRSMVGWLGNAFDAAGAEASIKYKCCGRPLLSNLRHLKFRLTPPARYQRSYQKPPVLSRGQYYRLRRALSEAFHDAAATQPASRRRITSRPQPMPTSVSEAWRAVLSAFNGHSRFKILFDIDIDC